MSIEPSLIPLGNEEISGATGDQARPDVSSRGLWSTFEHTFFDVKVIHPNAASYQSSSLPALYKKHEDQKMGKYIQRIVTMEKGTFRVQFSRNRRNRWLSATEEQMAATYHHFPKLRILVIIRHRKMLTFRKCDIKTKLSK